jgi:hypothetical protein
MLAMALTPPDANEAILPSMAARFASSAVRRVLCLRVLVLFVLAERVLHVGRGLEDGGDDGARAGIGRLFCVNANGVEACGRRESH